MSAYWELAHVIPHCDWMTVVQAREAQVVTEQCRREATRVLTTFCRCGASQVDLLCAEHSRDPGDARRYCRTCKRYGQVLADAMEEL